MNQKTKKTRYNTTGFTLIETMVAVFMFSVVLVSFLALVSNTIFYAKYSGDGIVANYLMQEVVDSIKNERSNNLLKSNPDSWSEFVSKFDKCKGPDGCRMDANLGSKSIEECSPNSNFSCLPLIYHKNSYNGSFYNYESYNNETDEYIDGSNFVRKIVVSSNPENPDELDVTVTVYWKSGSTDNKAYLSVSILNWAR